MLKSFYKVLNTLFKMEKFMLTEIKKNGYVFSVDRDKTSKYYETHSLCQCDGCQNFYKQIKGLFPEIEKLLNEFGVDISKPDEMPWYDIDNRIEYFPHYTVTGNIEKVYECIIDFENLKVIIHKVRNPFTDIPNKQTDPYFIIEVDHITLPWVLDTPFPSTSIRKNIISRLISKFKKPKLL